MMMINLTPLPMELTLSCNQKERTRKAMAETQPWPLWRTKASRLGEQLGRKWDLLMLLWQEFWNWWAAIEQFKAITLLRQQGWNCLWADLNQTTMPTRVLLARMSVCLQTVSSHAVNVPGIDSSLGRMENRRIVGAAVACNDPDTREAIMFNGVWSRGSTS